MSDLGRYEVNTVVECQFDNNPIWREEIVKAKSKLHLSSGMVDTVCPLCGEGLGVDITVISYRDKQELYIAGDAVCECGARFHPYGFAEARPPSED